MFRFLSNHRQTNHKIEQGLMDSYEQLGFNISLKMHFTFSHLHFFPLNCVSVSDVHAERFRQHISVTERRYRGKWSAAILDDYCWMMNRGSTETK
jgi:hypothetical protein